MILKQVIDETKITAAPPPKSYRTFIVKADWFWSSIQYDCRKNELDFRLDDISQQVCTWKNQRTRNILTYLRCSISTVYCVRINGIIFNCF